MWIKLIVLGMGLIYGWIERKHWVQILVPSFSSSHVKKQRKIQQTHKKGRRMHECHSLPWPAISQWDIARRGCFQLFASLSWIWNSVREVEIWVAILLHVLFLVFKLLQAPQNLELDPSFYFILLVEQSLLDWVNNW